LHEQRLARDGGRSLASADATRRLRPAARTSVQAAGSTRRPRAQAAALQDKAARWVSSAARKARARVPPLGDEQAAPGARRMLAARGGAGADEDGAAGASGEGGAAALQQTAADAAALAGGAPRRLAPAGRGAPAGPHRVPWQASASRMLPVYVALEKLSVFH